MKLKHLDISKLYMFHSRYEETQSFGSLYSGLFYKLIHLVSKPSHPKKSYHTIYTRRGGMAICRGGGYKVSEDFQAFEAEVTGS